MNLEQVKILKREIPQKIVLVNKKPGPELIRDFNVTGG